MGSTGNAFPVKIKKQKYTVIVGESPKQLFYAESNPAPFIRRVYSVVPVSSPQ
jgi:hypothetical protein